MTHPDEEIQHMTQLRAAAEKQLADASWGANTLSDSNAITRRILDTALDGFWRMGIQGNLLDVNPAYCKQSGYTREELLGLHVFDLEALESRADTAKHIKRVIEIGQGQFESLHYRKDGSTWPVEVSVTYHKNNAGEFFAFLRDISERKRSEEMLRKLSIAVEQGPASVLITDTQSRIQYVNPQFTEITGYSAAEVIGRTPSMFQSGQTSKETYRELWGKLRNGLTWHGELLNKRKNGGLYWEDVNIAPVKTTAGVITHYVGIKTDITWRKQAETLVHASLEIEASRKAVRNLAAHVENQREEERKIIAREIHDELGQILSVLRMDIALLKDRTGMDNAVMDDIERGMLGLVDQAIQAVRNVSHSLRPVQLGMGSIAAIEWLCTELTKHSGISCALKAVDDIDALPENIALILFRIVQESLTNVARHAAATGVDITITTSNGAIKVEIRDNGKGFDVKNLGVIKSFGLLGMSERAISIGGELNVTSKLGQGTIITLHIPNDPTTGAKSEKFATAGDASAGK